MLCGGMQYGSKILSEGVEATYFPGALVAALHTGVFYYPDAHAL